MNKYYLTDEMLHSKINNLTIEDIKNNNAEWFLNKLQEMSFIDVLQTISNLYGIKHKPQYPKTYVECCEILYPNGNFQIIAPPFKGHNYKKLFALQQLLICRDTYWKIAGEQMGLGKPWEPDWCNVSTTKYCITYKSAYGRNVIAQVTSVQSNYLLSFPTQDLCDEFYRNFEKRIEECKELL